MDQKKNTKQYKSINLNLSVPYHEDRETFVRKAISNAQKAARQQWYVISGERQRTGGAPTKKDLIYATCDEIWKERQEELLADKWSKNRFKEQVVNLLGSKGISVNHKTLEKHVDMWIKTSLPFDEAPTRMLIESHRDPRMLLMWFKLPLFLESLKTLVKHLPPGAKLKDLVNLANELDTKTKERIDQEWKENTQVQEIMTAIKNLEAIQEDPDKLKIFKQRLPEVVKTLHSPKL